GPEGVGVDGAEPQPGQRVVDRRHHRDVVVDQGAVPVPHHVPPHAGQCRAARGRSGSASRAWAYAEGRAQPRPLKRIAPAGKVVTAAGVSAGLDLGLWLAGEIAGRERAEAIQLYIEYDPQPPFDAGHPSKASKAGVDEAKPPGRQIALNPAELRAGPTVAWRRALNGFRARAATRATKGVHRGRQWGGG